MPATIRQKNFVAERNLYEYDVVDKDGSVVGMAQFRVKPSKSFELPGGFESHVYYEIEEAQRGKGYAKDALRGVMQKAVDFKINPLITTVNSTNTASIKVIESCGGRKAAAAQLADGRTVLKYQIPTAPEKMTSF